MVSAATNAATIAVPLAHKTEAAARRTGMSPRLLIKLRDSGEIPCIRRGRLVLFLESDLQEWLQRNRTQSAIV